MIEMASLLNTPLNPEKAFGIPLKECDQTVIEDTFCIVERHWGQTYVYRYSRLPTLYLFHPYSSIRRISIAFTTHVCYDIVLIIIIITYLIDLAIPNSLPLLFEHVSLIFYITEAVHQTVARGFIFGSYSYLKNPWMCFDFIITMLSLPDLELTVGVASTSFGIQALRGLRSLNLISKIPGVEVMAQGIILSMFRMYGVAVIICLFLLTVSLSAKQLFMGISHRRCVRNFSLGNFSTNVTFSEFINNNSNWDVFEGEYMICGNQTGAKKCNMNFTCLTTHEHETDYTSFDTFSHSLLNTFRLLTQDEWENIYDTAFEAFGTTSIFFFFPVVFLGSFFLLNLMLIVVASTFDSIMNVKEESQPLRNFKYDSFFRYDVKRLSLYPLPTSAKELRRVFKERDEIIIHQQWLNETWLKVKNIIALKLNVDEIDDIKDIDSIGKWKKFTIYLRKISDSKIFHYFILLTIITNTILMASVHSNMSKKFIEILNYCYMVITGIFACELIIKLIAYGKHFFVIWWNILDLIVTTLSLASLIFNLASEYSIFRSLRLLELVKVQQAWPALHRVVTIVLSSIGNIIRLLIVVLLVMFTFAVIGNRILGHQMKPNVQETKWSFATFGGSLFTVFKIFAGEWYISFSDCVRTSKTPLLCFIVTIPFYVVGYLVILNVFTAVLLSAFDASSLQHPEHKKIKEKETFEPNEESESASEFNRNFTKIQLFLQSYKKFIQSSKFEKIIFVLVLGSCFVMAFEDVTMESDITRKYVIEYLNLTFTILFTIEVLVRWLAIGVKKYFANSWMRFDFILVVLSLVELFVKHTFDISERNVHWLKLLRALRPLRLIPRWKGLQVVFDSLVISLPAIFHVVLVVLFIWLPFAILGVHFFAGKFFACVDKNQQKVTENIYNKTDCLKEGHTWQEMFYNFNHIGNSYLSLFQMAMFTGWTELVDMMVDFTSEDTMPVHDNHTEYYAFLVVFVFLGAFFSLNMFVAVAVDTFKNTQKMVKMEKNEMLLSENQRHYYAAILRLGKKKPVERTDRPSNFLMNVCYTITYNLWFRVIILIFIFANTVVIALHSLYATPFKKRFLHYCDRFFTVAYVLELIIKILGLRKYFFNDFWNLFDLMLVCVHFLGEFLFHSDSESEINPLSFIYAFRLLCVLRLLRLTDMIVDLRRLLHSMVASVPALINISTLLLIIVYIYTIFGVSIFMHLDFHQVITPTLNFRTFIQGFLLLFRLTTAQGWEEILESLSVQPPFCSEKEGNCGNFVIAVIFVLSFIIISNILLVNIFIAVILENYIEAIMQENDIINDDNLNDFYKVWKEFDPKATQFISYEQLPDFLDQLNKEMRIPKPNNIQIAYMNLPLMEGRKIHCLNVLKGILDIKTGDVEDSTTFRILCDQVQQKYDKMFPRLKSLRLIDTTMELKRRDFAARIIQRNLKKMREKKFD